MCVCVFVCVCVCVCVCACVRACVYACVFARLLVSMPARVVCMRVMHRVLLGDGRSLDDYVLLSWQSQVFMGGGREARPPRPSPSAPSHADLLLLTRSTAEVGPAYFTHRMTVNNPSTFTFIVGPGLSCACTHTPALQIWRVCAAASRHLSCMPALHLFCSRGGCTVAVLHDSFRRQALPVT